MEKFSSFSDSFTGINPFIAPKTASIRFSMIAKALFKLPFYILYILGAPTLHYLIKINVKNGPKPRGLVYANYVGPFGAEVIRLVYGLRVSSSVTRGSCIMFPEGTTTNNTAVLNFNEKSKCDYYIGLKFTPEAVYVYGNRLLWLIRFLGTDNHVNIACVEADNIPTPIKLAMTAGLPLVKMECKDKQRFLDAINDWKHTKKMYMKDD